MVYLITEALKKVDAKLDPAKKADLIKTRGQLRDRVEVEKDKPFPSGELRVIRVGA